MIRFIQKYFGLIGGILMILGSATTFIITGAILNALWPPDALALVIIFSLDLITVITMLYGTIEVLSFILQFDVGPALIDLWMRRRRGKV